MPSQTLASPSSQMIVPSSQKPPVVVLPVGPVVRGPVEPVVVGSVVVGSVEVVSEMVVALLEAVPVAVVVAVPDVVGEVAVGLVVGEVAVVELVEVAVAELPVSSPLQPARGRARPAVASRGRRRGEVHARRAIMGTTSTGGRLADSASPELLQRALSRGLCPA